MRRLQSHDEDSATQELRADEHLVPIGGITQGGYSIPYFEAATDEDLIQYKEDRLRHRREQRRNKQRQRQ